ncbi:MAG: PD-(D/E)XK nuclease family protein [Rudaea sp.]
MSMLLEAFAAGATVVTPNNRLARDAALRFDAAQRAKGARAWQGVEALPWSSWLRELWRAALASRAQAAPPALFDRSASRALFHAIVARHARDWLNSRGAARFASEAWTTFHAWRDSGERLDRVVAVASGDDPRIFGEWAEAYRARLEAERAIDEAQLPDTLAGLAHAASARARTPVVLYGFLSFTPQQRRLVDALRAVGMRIDELPTEHAAAARRARTSFATPSDELAHALSFARERVARNPAARVAIVVADLDARRDEVVALADEILCPDALVALARDATRPYGISLGMPLSEVPIVAAALDLVALASGPVAAPVATRLARSPFLPDATVQWTRRAVAERHWLDAGLREIDWKAFVAAMRDVDAGLAQRFAAAAPPAQALRKPREWAHEWSRWLVAIGWPGDATLSSFAWQAREAFSAALARFASLGGVTGRLAARAACDSLRAELVDAVFQPEAPPAQIQILGVLEAAGLAFDHAWLAGFDAQRWPGASAPNPLLPLAWQHARRVPRAHPETLLAQARAVTSSLAALADEIVVSHASTVDDGEAAISPLFASWEAQEASRVSADLRYTRAIAPARMERLLEHRAPALAEGASLRGGTRMFESQSACPFQAYARHRLAVEPWPACPDGLTAWERGNVVHAMMKSFWDVIGDQAALLALDESALAGRIDAAVGAAKAKLGTARWRALPPAVAEAEASRLAATLRAWIDEGERVRPPFRVRAHEKAIRCSIDGLALSARVDRIDEFASGGLAIVDYKSGHAFGPNQWFKDRPAGIQIAVYADAAESAEVAPVRALAYARLKAGDIGVLGIAESTELWPGLRSTAALAGDWAQARTRLREALVRLAGEIRDGVADVAPREPATCSICGMHALCRIQRLDDGSDVAEERDE